MPPDNKLSDDQIVDVVKRKRGSKPASIEANLSASTSEISEMISNVLYWYNRPQVKSDQECIDRLNDFFHHVAQTGEVPTVEKMCMCLGVVRQTVWNWKNGIGCTPTRMDIIKKAYDVLAALDAELVSKGKIPQVTYIFRAKNFFEMVDQTQISVAPANPLDGLSPDESRKRYTQAIPDTATDGAEE